MPPRIALTTRSALRPSTGPTTFAVTARRCAASSPGAPRQRSMPATTSSNERASWKAPEAATSV